MNSQQLDIVYYSKYCKYSDNVLQYIVRNNLVDRFNFINVDKRKRDPKTNQWLIHLDNGKIVMLPPNVVNVPSLCLVSEKYRVIVGNQIIEYLEPIVKNRVYNATKMNGEPSSFSLMQSGLSSIGNSISHFSPVLSDNEGLNIITPPEDYKSSRMTDEMASNAIKQVQDDMSQYMAKQPSNANAPQSISSVSNMQYDRWSNGAGNGGIGNGIGNESVGNRVNNFQQISYKLNL